VITRVLYPAAHLAQAIRWLLTRSNSGDAGGRRVFAPFGNSNYNGATLPGRAAAWREVPHVSCLATRGRKQSTNLHTPIDVYNLSCQPVRCRFRYADQVHGSWVYQLPVGKGQGSGSWQTGECHRWGGWD